tara:strand:+ start:334 stop:531 length:198 start_codon:yes stop_codon:yes gene_type:complete
MDATFGDAIAYYSYSNDNESRLFIEYILLKYFNDKSFFMKMQEAAPYLEKNDKEMLFAIASKVRT